MLGFQFFDTLHKKFSITNHILQKDSRTLLGENEETIMSKQQPLASEEQLCMTSYDHVIDIMNESETNEDEAGITTPPRGTDFARRIDTVSTSPRKEKVKPAYSSPSMIRHQRQGDHSPHSPSTNSATTSGSGKQESNTLENLVNMADPVTDDDASEFDSDEKEEEYRL